MEIYMDDLARESPYELGKNLKYLETIDHGAFGTVIHVKEISSNKDMAIKVINKTGAGISLIKKMKEEISILRQLNHENIVKFFGFLETNNQLLIKMEFIKYGTLSKWIKNHKKISEEDASIILNQVLSAVIYLHSKQICHRDIKPENIMLSKENDLHSIKIIDFGLSAQNFDKLINNDYCGTYIYMAPEQIEKKLYFISVDIWSIGILMFMLLNNGKHPFYIKGDNRQDFVKKIQECKITFYNKVSPMAKHLILKLLEPNPSWRYTGSQAIKHPWITRNKDDEVPKTFNEILAKSNNKKIARDLFNVCLFMNYFSKKKKKYIINKEYIDNCNYYNEKIKKKFMKKKEKCLDVLSTDEGDDEDSYDKKSFGKEHFENNKEKEKQKNKEDNNINVLNLNNEQHSIIISPIKIKRNKNRKLNFTKSSKNINYLNKKFVTDKKNKLNFRKINVDNISSIKKKINFNKNNNNQPNDEEIKTIKNINPNTSVQNFNVDINTNKDLINSKLGNDNKTKKINKINNYNYLEKQHIINRLPHIASPHKRNDFNLHDFSFNNIDNFNIVPIVLPNIENIKKTNNIKYENIRKSMKNLKKKSSKYKK
jgi:serine/threonine protein kinase